MDEEAECPICQEYLTDPVSVDCGHSFCRACITKVCDHTWSKHGPLECPLCKARFRGSNIRTNWQLRSIVEKIKAGGMRMPPIPAGKHITGRDLQGKDSACSGSDTRLVILGALNNRRWLTQSKTGEG
uniref:RING-type domain-containing protein n=1 Tax=Sphenodon punctatus TaxID=8508 RepID=A0A8D0GBL3_SPHPU